MAKSVEKTPKITIISMVEELKEKHLTKEEKN